MIKAERKRGRQSQTERERRWIVSNTQNMRGIMTRKKTPEIEKEEEGEKMERRVREKERGAAEKQPQACCAVHGGGSSFS